MPMDVQRMRLLRVAGVVVTLLAGYLVYAAAGFVAEVWAPVGFVLFFGTSLVVLAGIFLVARTWDLSRRSAVFAALWVYLFVGLWGLALLALFEGPTGLFWVLLAGLVALGVFAYLSPGRPKARVTAAWSYIVLGVGTVVAMTLVLRGPVAMVDGLMIAFLWPTMLLWYSNCMFPLLTWCIN